MALGILIFALILWADSKKIGQFYYIEKRTERGGEDENMCSK